MVINIWASKSSDYEEGVGTNFLKCMGRRWGQVFEKTTPDD